jgi:hypothetical protein
VYPLAVSGIVANVLTRRVSRVAFVGAALLVGCSTNSAGQNDAASPIAVSETTTGSSLSSPSVPAEAQKFPDIVAVTATARGGTWTFDVTISSPYDTPQRYADGWRVLGPDGTVYGEHELTHDHATEQPFTRTQEGVAIPNGVDVVTVEGRDRLNGYGGKTAAVTLGSP